MSVSYCPVKTYILC